MYFDFFNANFHEFDMNFFRLFTKRYIQDNSR